MKIKGGQSSGGETFYGTKLQGVTGDITLNFGKHRDKPCADIPVSYLSWISENVDLPDKEYELLQSVLRGEKPSARPTPQKKPKKPLRQSKLTHEQHAAIEAHEEATRPAKPRPLTIEEDARIEKLEHQVIEQNIIIEKQAELLRSLYEELHPPILTSEEIKIDQALRTFEKTLKQ
jgi:hypothetical protein